MNDHLNMPVGIRHDTRYRSGRAFIRPGDRLLLFTDGCTEQKNKNEKLFGERRFIQSFKKMVNDGERNVVGRLHKEVLDYAGGVPIGDDIAILLCEFNDKG